MERTDPFKSTATSSTLSVHKHNRCDFANKKQIETSTERESQWMTSSRAKGLSSKYAVTAFIEEREWSLVFWTESSFKDHFKWTLHKQHGDGHWHWMQSLPSTKWIGNRESLWTHTQCEYDKKYLMTVCVVSIDGERECILNQIASLQSIHEMQCDFKWKHSM